MIYRLLKQALVSDGRFVARSAYFTDDDKTLATQLLEQFGLPASGDGVPILAVTPFGKQQIAILNSLGRITRILVLDRKLYDVIPDPFAISDRFPSNTDQRDPLPTLEWPAEPLPRRLVADLQRVLKHGDSPFLLGASQTLVDSGRIVLQRTEPAETLFRDLWTLLPDSTRRTTYFSTWALTNQLNFQMLAMPEPPPEMLGYLSEDQTRDYPESRYERELQVAIETADQASLDRLLHRRSTSETLRLGLWMLLAVFLISLASKIMMR